MRHAGGRPECPVQPKIASPELGCEALRSWRWSWSRERHRAPLKVGPAQTRDGWPSAGCQMAQLSLLPDAPVKLAGDGRGASTRRWSALVLLMRQRGVAPLVD